MGLPQCVSNNSNISFYSCQILSAYESRIYFGQISTIETTLSGSISPFVNPQTTMGVSPIKITLFASQGMAKTTALVSSLSNFSASNLTVTLNSSSNIVGASGQTLQINITPSLTLKSIGSIILTTPQYYPNSGNDGFFDLSNLSCVSSFMSINRCTFSAQSKQLTINYSFNDGQDHSNQVQISVGGFKNPIKPIAQGGFFVLSQDNNNYTIGSSQEIILSGITAPQQLNFVTIGFDSLAVVGMQSNLKVNLGASQAFGMNCFVQINFPPEFTVDGTLTSISGTGIFTGVQTINIDAQNRIIKVQACMVVYGPSPQQGTLIFSQIKNPKYLTATQSFQVFVGMDQSFAQGTLIASLSSGIIVPSNFFQPGPINNIQIVPQDPTYGALTSYNFSFTPNSNLSSLTGTQFTIDVPNTLKFPQNYCAVVAKSANISNSITCQLSGQKILLNYVFSNQPLYIGGTPIQLSIFGIQNPNSQFNLGSFTISTFMLVNSAYMLVDQGKNIQPVTAQAGLVTKTREVAATSFVANAQGVTYTFNMQFTYPIPNGGSILVTFDDSVKVGNPNLMQNSCYRLNFSNQPTQLQCTITYSSISVQVSQPAFSANGLVPGEEFRLQVAPITNRRDTFAVSSFNIQSQDIQGNPIDTSANPSPFTMRMTSSGSFGSISASVDNLTNGAIANYIFSLTSNVDINQGDSVLIQFPKQIGLPQPGYLNCAGDSNVVISVGCALIQSDTIRFTLIQINGITSGNPFSIKLAQVRNSYSNAPTDPFPNVTLQDQLNRIVASGLDNTVTLQNNIVSKITQMTLAQSSKDPGALATYTLTFQTNNPINRNAAMQIVAPLGVSFYQNSDGCLVITSGSKNNVCRFSDNSTLQIRNAFSDQQQDYTGQVTISFSAYNPPNNLQQTLSFTLQIYTDSSFQYSIDVINNGLSPQKTAGQQNPSNNQGPTTKCNYPCLTCSDQFPDQCTSCPVGQFVPQFLQTDALGRSTCKQACDQGYTFNVNVNKICYKCDPSCATCQTGGGPNARAACTSCSPLFPYFWQDQSKCYSPQNKCPAGSYEYSKQLCRSCPAQCYSCTSPYNCVQCNPKSSTPFMENGLCVSACSTFSTSIFQNGFYSCQQCQAPCAECQQGQPSLCTKCQTNMPYLMDSQCQEKCGEGFRNILSTMSCKACPAGCKICDDTDTCLNCQKGLVFNDQKQCTASCGPQFQKSSDGTTCEKRIYPLNNPFVQFPFCYTTLVLISIAVVSWFISDRTTLINQTFIVFLTIILQLAVLFEILSAMIDQQKTFIAIPIVILCANLALNLAFTFTFLYKIDDFQYNEFKENNQKLFKVVVYLSILWSFNIFRITYCKFLLIEGFKASATDPAEFLKPLKFYSRIYCAVILLPLLILNMVGAIVAKKAWGTNQLQMTMVEICILSMVFAIAIVIEQFIQSPRKMLFKPSLESSLFSGLFKKKKTHISMVSAAPPDDDEEKSQDSSIVGDSAFWPLQEKNFRFERLEEVIRAVKRYKDINLNNCFDNIMDVEIGQLPKRRCDTDFEPQYPLPLEQEIDIYLERKHLPIPDQDFLNKSFPGINETYDENFKRIQLLEYFERQAIEDAQNERKFIERLAKANRYKDKEVMYDAAMIDNCFFAAKKKADNCAQTVVELREQGIDPMDLIPLTTIRQQTPSLEPDLEIPAQIPNFEDTMTSNRPLKKPETAEIGTITDQLPDIKTKKTNDANGSRSIELMGPVEHEQRVMTPLEKQKFQIGEELTNLEEFSSHSSYERSGDSQTSNETIGERDQNINQGRERSINISIHTEFERKPDKEMWIQKADYLKTIILADIEIARKQKEPYKGLNLTKERQSEFGESTLQTLDMPQKRHKQNQAQNVIEHYLTQAQSQENKQPDEKIEEPIQEEDFDQIDALFYKNNYPYESRYSVSSIHTSQLESIPCDKAHKDDFTAWMREIVEINQRSFNIFEVVGNFPMDSSGNIVDRDQTIIESNFLDRDGFLVNEKGFLINEVTGAIRSRYTYDDLFKPEVGDLEDLGELPMPYRLEKFNFNPHRITGSFDYDKKQPIFLKNKYNNLTDKHFRPVNHCGFLINEREDIIDTDGHVKFIAKQLGPRGNLQPLYPYKGEPFDVKDIIGRFQKDDASKEIILKFDNVRGRAVDEDGRLVNSAGYLIDEKGNIVNKKGQIKFNFWEILFNEPPKIFSFTEFSIKWIKGALEKDVTQNPMHNDEFDLKGRRINSLGYLINKDESIVDQHGKVVFKNDILTKMYNQDAQIPEVFRSGKLRQPLNWSNVQDKAWKLPEKQNQSFKKEPKATSESKKSIEETAIRSDYISKEGGSDFTKKEFTGSIGVMSRTDSKQSSLSKPSSQTKQPPSPLNQLNIKINLGSAQEDPFKKTKQIIRNQELPLAKKKRAKSSKNRLTSENQKLNLRPGVKVLQLYTQYLDGTPCQPPPQIGKNQNLMRSHSKLINFENVPRLKRNTYIRQLASYADQAEPIFANDGRTPQQMAEEVLYRDNRSVKHNKIQMMAEVYSKKQK